MTPTATETARAEPRKTTADALPIALVGVAEFAGYGPDTRGDVRTLGAYVGRAMPTAEVRRLDAELQDAVAAGREMVKDQITTAINADATVAALRNREAKLKESLAKYQQELKTAERDLDAAERTTEDALRRGEDADPAGQREVALVEQVRVLRRYVTGTQEGLTETHAEIVRAISAVGRTTRARLQQQAEQQLDELSASVANALFANLISITRTRAAFTAARDG